MANREGGVEARRGVLEIGRRMRHIFDQAGIQGTGGEEVVGGVDPRKQAIFNMYFYVVSPTGNPGGGGT